MRYRKVKKMADLSFSSVGLGCWAFSGKSVWDGYDEKASVETVHRAIYEGIRFFDVAPVYGFGQAEKVLGKALKGNERESFTIATKCGLVWDDSFRMRNDLSPASILAEVDASLKRLQIDVIDLYQMHWPHPSTPIGETMEVLLRLQEQGKIKYIGASNFSVTLNDEAMQAGRISSQQGLYNMIERNPTSYHNLELTYRTEREILPYCKKHEQAFFPYSPLFQGLLADAIRPKSTFSKEDVRNQNPNLQGDRFHRYFKLVTELKQYCDESIGKPLNQVAINWLLHHKEVTSVICGAQTPEQISANARAAEWELTDGHFQELNQIVENHTSGW